MDALVTRKNRKILIGRASQDEPSLSNDRLFILPQGIFGLDPPPRRGEIYPAEGMVFFPPDLLLSAALRKIIQPPCHHQATKQNRPQDPHPWET